MNPVVWLLTINVLLLAIVVIRLWLIHQELQKMNSETEKVARLLISARRTRQGHMSNAVGESPTVRPDMTGSIPRKAAQRASGAKTVIRGGEPVGD